VGKEKEKQAQSHRPQIIAHAMIDSHNPQLL